MVQVDRPHKGPFVLSFPLLGLHCPPQRRAQWHIVPSRKGPLVQHPALQLGLSSGLPLQLLPRVGEASRRVCWELLSSAARVSCPVCLPGMMSGTGWTAGHTGHTRAKERPANGQDAHFCPSVIKSALGYYTHKEEQKSDTGYNMDEPRNTKLSKTRQTHV
jgi:hypothetical protein